MNTTYFLNLVAGNLFRTKEVPAIPEKYYLGLSSTVPSLDGTGATEPPASAAYQRMELDVLSEPTNGVITNASQIDFPESTADWGKMTHFLVFDAATGGNLLMYGLLNKSRTVEEETVMSIKAGSLNLSVINPAAA